VRSTQAVNKPAPAPTAKAAATTYEFSPGEVLRTPTFYLLWLIYFIGAGAGLMVISSISGMAKKSLGDAAFVAVAVMAIGNAAGESLDPVFQDGVVLDADALQKKRWRGAVPLRNRVWAHMPNQLVMRCQTDGLLVYQAAVARRRTRPTRPLP